MAGYYGLAQGAVEGLQALEQQKVRDQEMQYRALQMQAMQNQARQQQASQQAALNAAGDIRSLLAGGQGPQPPMPGQPSVPMAPPTPQPMMPPQSMQAPQPSMPPQSMPPQQPMPMRIPPYQTVPQGQPQPPAPQQSGMIAPPQQVGEEKKSPLDVIPDPMAILRKLAADPKISNEEFLAAQEQAKPFVEMQMNRMQIEKQIQADANRQRQLRLDEARLDEMKRYDDWKMQHGDESLDRQVNKDKMGSAKPKISVVFDDKGHRYSQVVSPDGTIAMKDAQGRDVDPDSIVPRGAPSQETMRNAVKLDITEIDYALDKISTLGSKTASPWFADKNDKGAFTRWTQNDLTPEEMQRYNVFANRIAPAIASLQTMGRGQISDAKVSAAAKLIPVPGDNDQTIKDKLAAIKAIRDRSNQVLKGKSPDEIKEQLTDTPTQAGPYSDADKEARYQAWKKAHASE